MGRPKVQCANGASGAPIFDYDLATESHTVTGDGAIPGLTHPCDAYNTANGTIVFDGTGLTLTATAFNCRLTNAEDKAPTVGFDWATIDPSAVDGDRYAVVVDHAVPSWPGSPGYYWGGLEIRAATRGAGNQGHYWNSALGVKAIRHVDFVSNSTESATAASGLRGQLAWAVRYTMDSGYTQDQLRLFMAKYDGVSTPIRLTRIRVWKLS